MPKYGKHRGAETELKACAWLLGEGYEVFRNVSPFGSVDIIATKDGVTRYIDVKSGTGSCEGTGTAVNGVEILYPWHAGGFRFRKARSKWVTREMTPREKIIARLNNPIVDGVS